MLVQLTQDERLALNVLDARTGSIVEASRILGVAPDTFDRARGSWAGTVKASTAQRIRRALSSLTSP